MMPKMEIEMTKKSLLFKNLIEQTDQSGNMYSLPKFIKIQNIIKKFGIPPQVFKDFCRMLIKKLNSEKINEVKENQKKYRMAVYGIFESIWAIESLQSESKDYKDSENYNRNSKNLDVSADDNLTGNISNMIKRK